MKHLSDYLYILSFFLLVFSIILMPLTLKRYGPAIMTPFTVVLVFAFVTETIEKRKK